MKGIEVNEVLATSTIDDWDLDVEANVLKYKYFDDLTIIKVVGSCKSQEECFWKDHCDIEHGKRLEYMVKLRGAYIGRYSFVEIDNIGIVLPLPRSGSKEISVDQLNLAKIVNTKVSIDELIEQSALKIRASYII